MAKVRRIIRTVRPDRPVGFDEQLWPVDVALIVLGGFLIGVNLAYLKFDDPRWYANAIVWLIATPILVLGTMAALRLVSSRMVRRSMQLAMVVSVVVHVLFLVSMINIVIFSRMWPEVTQTAEVSPRQPKVIPDYHPVYTNPEQKKQPDFEKPVETKTPEVQVDEVVQKQETTEKAQPDRPQPTPVPEPEQTVQPSLVKRQETSESVPRHAEQSSRLSRQTSNVQPRPNQPVAVPQLASNASAAAQAAPAASQVERQMAAASQPQRRPAEAEPTTDVRQQQVQLTRRQPEVQPQADATAAPTMPRQQAQPTLTPRTQVNAADTSAVAQRTEPTQLTPRNTEATRQTTASPEVARRATEPVPETPTQTAPKPQRRQLDSTPAPQVAQTPVPVPGSRVRATTRPDPTPASPTVARAAQPSPTASQPTSTPQARSTPLERTASTPATARPATPTQPQPSETQPTASQVARPTTPRATRSEATPQVTSPAPTTAVARRSTQATATPTSQAQAEQAASVTRESTTGEVSPTSVATQKQNVAQPQVAERAAEPSPATTRRPPTSATARAVERAASESAVPAVAQNPNSNQNPSVARSSTARNTPQSQVSAENVAASSAPTRSDNPQPSRQASEVARAPAQSAVATPTSRPLDAPSLSPTAQAAGSTAVRRSETSPVPTLDPQGRPSPQPARAVRSATVAASPTSVESPAVAQAAQPSGGPSAQPAQTVLNRSRSGVAGIGEARNLDRAKPADETPSAVASAAATRREATQQANEGPALSPSSPALVSRNRAEAPRPSATLRAQPVELATTAGSDQPSELSATSSAAVVEAASNATTGPVSAAAGSLEVDMGPSRVVSEGGAGRAAGGGQPQLSSSNEPPQLTRSGTGAAERMALAVPQTALVAAAPDGTGGGRPAPTELDPAATAAVRTDAGGDVPISGGPSPSSQVGPASQSSRAELAGAVQLRRADSTATAAGGAPSESTAVPDLDEEEERARRIARSATGGAPQLAMAAPQLQDVPAGARAERTGAEDAPAIAARSAAGNVERSAESGGSPAATAPAAEGSRQPAESSAGGDLIAATQMRRAEAVEAATGPVETGGGSGSPTRSAVGPKFVANNRAEVVAMAGAPQSAGAPAGAPLEAQGTEQARLAGGVVAPTGSDAVGAAAGPQVIDVAMDAAPGTAAGTRRAAPATDEDGPSLGDVGTQGAPLPRADRVALAGGPSTVAQVVIPQPAGAGTEAMPDMADLAGGMDGLGPMARQATGGLAVDMQAVEGPGGLGQEYATDVGINNRRAREDSLQVQATPARFARQQVGGTPDFNTAAVVAAQPFQGRMARRPGDTSGGAPGSSGPQTEESIERGLAFLARNQRGDGSWTLKGFGEEVALASDTAATGLSLLAFQGAGYTHKEYHYADVVRGGVEFLVKNQKENGDLFVPLDDESNRSVWLYSHGIAAIALCEAYGMTQDPDLRGPAQKAIDFIVASQHKDRGAWRYAPNVGSDTSVTGWMMMALKSGELANLDVPKDCYQKIETWLDLSQASSRDRHLYRYNPYAPDTLTQRHGREASATMTAVGLLMRLYSGWRRDNDNIVRGADYLQQNLPTLGTVRDPQRDTYYWYYATQVMFHMGGKHWEAWHGKLHPLLVDQQQLQGPLAGSWDPRGPIPDRWAPHAGRLYVTTMNLLSLEVSYRHLPLYEDTGK